PRRLPSQKKQQAPTRRCRKHGSAERRLPANPQCHRERKRQKQQCAQCRNLPLPDPYQQQNPQAGLCDRRNHRQRGNQPVRHKKVQHRHVRHEVAPIPPGHSGPSWRPPQTESVRDRGQKSHSEGDARVGCNQPWYSTYGLGMRSRGYRFHRSSSYKRQPAFLPSNVITFPLSFPTPFNAGVGMRSTSSNNPDITVKNSNISSNRSRVYGSDSGLAFNSATHSPITFSV